MSQSKSETNIPIIRKPFSAELPPRVPYIDADAVGSDVQFVYVSNRKIVPTTRNMGGLRDGKKYFLYMENGVMKDDMPASSVSITPQGNGTVTIATFTIDGVTGYIKAGGGGGDTNINNLDVPLLTPMFFDYEYRLTDDICWIPAIRPDAGNSSSYQYQSMYDGQHNVTAKPSSETTPDSSTTYFVYDSDIEDYRECVVSDFNLDGSFKSGTTYYKFNHRGYRIIYQHLRKELNPGASDISANTYASSPLTEQTDTYTLSNGTTVQIKYKKSADGHKICAYSADTINKLDSLYNDVEIGTAWYYVIDTTNKKFRLPRTRYGLHGDKTYVKTAQTGNASMFLYFHTGNRGSESNSQLVQTFFDLMYPVGSIYISVNNETPFQNIPGVTSVWDRIPSDLSLWSANDHLGDTVSYLIPQHSHSYTRVNFGSTTQYGGAGQGKIGSTSSTTGPWPANGDSHIGNTLRPPSILVSIWKRVS